jgi:hypothetical protein
MKKIFYLLLLVLIVIAISCTKEQVKPNQENKIIQVRLVTVVDTDTTYYNVQSIK